MQKKVDKKSKRSTMAIILEIIFISIILGYFIILIFGKYIFNAENVFYKGVNIFNTAEEFNIWIRTLSYIIFFLSLSYIIRFILQKIASLMKKGCAFVNLLASFIKYIAVIALIFAVLNVWGVNTTALLAGIGILSLVVGLGAQPLIEDIIAGLFIVFEQVFDVGDIIVVDGFRGTVKEIGIRTTQIEDAGGDIKVINNSDIRTIVNMTSQLSIAISEVDIEYSESLEKVESIINANLSIIKNNIPTITEGPFYMGVQKLGASGVTLRFIAKCLEMDKFQVEREMNRQIKILFDKNNINIPFSQIVIHQANMDERKKNNEK